MKEQESSWGYTPSKTINFVLAVSAVFISMASFYATYLQANSAEQQVKAMTYPLMQFTSGNYNSALGESSINLTMVNAGVGPAIIKNVQFLYQGGSYNSLYDFLKACCEAGYNQMRDQQSSPPASIEGQLLTSFVKNTIIPAGGDRDIMQLRRRPNNDLLWTQLNEERFKLQLEVCYCSLLEQCYVAVEVGSTVEVDACPTE